MQVSHCWSSILQTYTKQKRHSSNALKRWEKRRNMNLLRKLDSSDCELIRDENLTKYNAWAIKEGEAQIKTVEDVYPCLEIEVFDNGEIWFSGEGFDEQRGYNAEEKGTLIVSMDGIDISVKIKELFKEDMIVTSREVKLSRNTAIFQWKGEKTSNWFIDGKRQYTYLKGVQVWNDRIEIYTDSKNAKVNNKTKLDINSVITIKGVKL